MGEDGDFVVGIVVNLGVLVVVFVFVGKVLFLKFGEYFVEIVGDIVQYGMEWDVEVEIIVDGQFV